MKKLLIFCILHAQYQGKFILKMILQKRGKIQKKKKQERK